MSHFYYQCQKLTHIKSILSLLSVQICDIEWHYYVINVEFPAVTLFVDGVTYDPYLVTDDWPIHPSQIDVQLTVGACWQGERNVFVLCRIFFSFCYISKKYNLYNPLSVN